MITSLDPCQGSLHKGIFLFSLPLMFTNILQVLFNIVDIAVAGHFAGTVALGAVGSTAMPIFFCVGMIIGIASGVNAIVAYYAGAQRSAMRNTTIYTAFSVCLASGILLMIAGIALSRTVLGAMNTKPELMDSAVLYFCIFMLGLPAMSLYSFGNAVLNAVGDTRRPLLYLFIAGIVNVVLDIIFIVVFHLGVMGVALATVLSQILSAVLVLLAVFRHTPELDIHFSNLYFNGKSALHILKIGVPAGFQQGVFAIANSFIQMGINSFDAVMVAGCAAEDRLDAMVYQVMAAFYIAGATFIGQNYGAGNKKRIFAAYRISIGYAFAAGVVMGILFLLTGRELIGLFTPDAAVVDAGMKKLYIMSFSFCISAFMDGSVAAARGLGKTLVPSFIIIMGSCVFRLAWIFTIFAYFRTLESLFLLFIFSWAITGFAATMYFLKIYKSIPD